MISDLSNDEMDIACSLCHIQEAKGSVVWSRFLDSMAQVGEHPSKVTYTLNKLAHNGRVKLYKGIHETTIVMQKEFFDVVMVEKAKIEESAFGGPTLMESVAILGSVLTQLQEIRGNESRAKELDDAYNALPKDQQNIIAETVVEVIKKGGGSIEEVMRGLLIDKNIKVVGGQILPVGRG